jgi:hypothetical protein
MCCCPACGTQATRQTRKGHKRSKHKPGLIMIGSDAFLVSFDVWPACSGGECFSNDIMARTLLGVH